METAPECPRLMKICEQLPQGMPRRCPQLFFPKNNWRKLQNIQIFISKFRTKTFFFDEVILFFVFFCMQHMGFCMQHMGWNNDLNFIHQLSKNLLITSHRSSTSDKTAVTQRILTIHSYGQKVANLDTKKILVQNFLVLGHMGNVRRFWEKKLVL